MEQVPDHLDAPLERRGDEGLDRGEVILSATVDQRPADRLAHRVDADLVEALVVGGDVQVVLGGGHLVDPLAVHVVAGRALEAGEVEAAEHQARQLSGATSVPSATSLAAAVACVVAAVAAPHGASLPTAREPPATSSR